MVMFRSLRSRVLMGVAVALLLITGIAGFRALDRRNADVVAAVDKLQSQVDAIAARHADIMRNTHTLIVALLTDLDINSFGTGTSCRTAMGELLAREPALDNIGIAPPNGMTVCNGRNNPPLDLSGKDYFQQAWRESGTVVGAPMLASGTGHWVLPYARAIRDLRGNPQAMVLANVSLSNLIDEFSRGQALKSARMGVVDSKGMVLAHYPDPQRMVGRDISNEPFFKTMLAAGGRGYGEEPGLDGEPRVYAFTRLEATDAAPIYVWVSQYKDMVTGNTDGLLISALLINLMIGCAIFLALWFSWEGQVMRPLSAIMSAARRLSAGDFKARCGVTATNEEFSTLGRLFDEMAESLSSKAEVLQLNRALKVLSGCAKCVVKAGDEKELLDGVCRIIVETGNYGQAWVGFAENDDYGTVQIGHAHGRGFEDYLRNQKISWREGRSNSPVALAIRTGKRQTLQDLSAASEDPLPEWRRLALEFGYHAHTVFPLLDNGVAFGVLVIFSGQAQVFTDAELNLLDELAEDLSFGILTRRAQLHYQRTQAKIEHLARVDPVTGLPNKTELLAHLEKSIARTNANNHQVAVLSVGIDRLSEVQDAIGIAGVDVVLCQFARRLSAHMAGIHFVARNSVDSLAIVAPLSVEPPASVARVVWELTEEPFEYAGIPIGLQTTVGVALFPDHGNDPDTLLRHADIAVRRARAAGYDFKIYSGGGESENPQNLALLAALRKGIRDNQLVLFYQPKVSTHSAEVIGTEALVRWKHPERGMVPPGVFITLAERTGLIKPLTYWVIGAALQQLARWQENGGGTRIAVNVSQFNLRDADFFEQFTGLPAKYGARLEGLDIEITESALMEDPAHSRALLERISNLGVRIYIDDFGTGYSSLAYLATLPIHALKIDRSFVIQMHEPRYRTIIESTITMAHSLGMKVVAEGVETMELVKALADLGCDEIQGYVYSKPLPAEELDQWRAQFGGKHPA